MKVALPPQCEEPSGTLLRPRGHVAAIVEIPDLCTGWGKTVEGKHEAAGKNQGADPRLDFVLLLP
jgi:hypothetical protein